MNKTAKATKMCRMEVYVRVYGEGHLITNVTLSKNLSQTDLLRLFNGYASVNMQGL